MGVVILHNPRSGRGRSASIVDALDAALRASGRDLDIVEVGAPSLGHLLRRADAIVIVGGDGTVHHALVDLVAANRPLCIAPMGTENLLARELSMRPDAALIARTLGEAHIRPFDVGAARGARATRRFAVMLSVGPDASVIHRLARARRGSISHTSYIRPIVQEALRPQLPALTIDADGRRIVENRTGLLVVANSRQYALRVDPAADADPADGLLDIVFFPCSTALGAVLWLVRSRCRRALRRRGCIAARAKRIRIEPGADWPAGASLPLQLDGEAVELGAGPIDVTIEPGALPVFAVSPAP